MKHSQSRLFLEILDGIKCCARGDPDSLARLSFSTTPTVNRLFLRLSLAINGGKGLNMESVTGGGCNTTHCIAGWVIELAGQDGHDLYDGIGWSNASDMIMAASCPWLDQLPSYYSDDKTAMNFINTMLEKEMAYYALPR